MFKIKLLILLLSSILVSCASSQKVDKPKLDLNYVAGGVNGLIMNNMLKNYLQNYGLYDENSNLKSMQASLITVIFLLLILIIRPKEISFINT